MISSKIVSPPSLKAGARIVLIAPAGSMQPQPVIEAASVLRNLGYSVEYGNSVFGSYGVFSGTDSERLNDLQSALNRDDVDAIWCVRGGYGVMRIVDKLDFSGFVKHPKWLIGFSDITVLHSAIQRLTGVATLHAPMMKHICDFGAGDCYVAETLALLEGARNPVKCSTNHLSHPGKARGVLIGGNLSLLYALRGTGFDIIPDGKILFIEDIGEYNYHLDRMLQNMRLGGVFDCINGLVVGHFTDMKDGATPYGADAYAIISEIVSGRDYPIWFGFPAGHQDDNHPLMLGAEVGIDIDTHASTLNYIL